METQPKYQQENQISLISSHREISGESFKVKYPESPKVYDIYRMGATWYKLNQPRVQAELGEGEMQRINESFLSLINTSDVVLVPSVKDGIDLGNFYAEFTKQYENAYNMGNWASTRQEVLKKIYPVAGYVDTSVYDHSYFDTLQRSHRQEYLGNETSTINFYMIGDLTPHSPMKDVVHEFIKSVNDPDLKNASISLYTNPGAELKKIEEQLAAVDDQAVRDRVKIVSTPDKHGDLVNKAIAVGDVYIGTSNYESYNHILYKSIFAGKGLMLPFSPAILEVAGSEEDGNLLHINPHFSTGVIRTMKRILDNPGILSDMMIANRKHSRKLSKEEYDHRVKMSCFDSQQSVFKYVNE